MRALLAAAVAVLISLAAAAPASADVCPPYEGVQFPEIHSSADPEDYCWEVQLEEGEELRQVDEQHAAVYYTEPEHLAFEITATLAHDADGAAVPTSIEVTGERDVTLTVHHRAGNPAAGGAPFDYPISPGGGWEGGFESHEIEGPPDEAAQHAASLALASPEAASHPQCKVPDLLDDTLRAARKQLRRANCRLGPVHGKRSRTARVAHQFRKPGTSLPAGTKVGVKLSG